MCNREIKGSTSNSYQVLNRLWSRAQAHFRADFCERRALCSASRRRSCWSAVGCSIDGSLLHVSDAMSMRLAEIREPRICRAFLQATARLRLLPKDQILRVSFMLNISHRSASASLDAGLFPLRIDGRRRRAGTGVSLWKKNKFKKNFRNSDKPGRARNLLFEDRTGD